MTRDPARVSDQTSMSDQAAWLLAIDSSSEQAGLALFNGIHITELSWPAGRSQTTMLLAAIHQILTMHQLEPTGISAVAVAVGPGPFSGLRVGLSVAKGLVLGLDIPIVGVPTLEAAAVPYAAGTATVVPLVPAGRGRIVWSAYGRANGRWAELAPPRNSTIDDLIDDLPGAETVIVSGEVDAGQEQRLLAVDRVRLPPPGLRARRPGAVASLAWNRLATGDTDDPGSLQAIYAGREQS
ncbi:MAG: tRNA (adenosine(37)-N6)-threonylcarbamoyltransferase complex dimerization subunit type 1 TsaB [Chloroflexota bacterium]|nr:tRNA (adenosine(37)-N6)-threonylcarbamoyltransferase complex dimerization subunit type 1 TsaB [Chloroflexota bacterium]